MSPGASSTDCSTNVELDRHAEQRARSRSRPRPCRRSRRMIGGGWPPHAIDSARAAVVRGCSSAQHTVQNSPWPSPTSSVSCSAVSRRLGDRSCRPTRAQRVPGESGDRGGLRSLAAHVADHEPPRAFVDLEHVVEVAADLVALAGRLVPRGDARAGDRGQRRRKQARLQRARDVVAFGVQARVVDRQPGTARELLGEREIGRAEATARSRRHERERAEHPARGLGAERTCTT